MNRHVRTALTCAAFAQALLGASRTSLADHFENAYGRRGCDSSIRSSPRDKCFALQKNKDPACYVGDASCNPEKQEKDIAELHVLRARLDGVKNDDDTEKKRLNQQIRDLVTLLDARRAASGPAMKAAQACIDARLAVQDHFVSQVIPMTEKALDDAVRTRRELLDTLKAAEDRRRAAKEKRDANPDDSAIRSDYERASDEHRAAEKDLENFNYKHGRDIERNAGYLIHHYKDESVTHLKPIEETRNRYNNCDRLERLRY